MTLSDNRGEALVSQTRLSGWFVTFENAVSGIFQVQLVWQLQMQVCSGWCGLSAVWGRHCFIYELCCCQGFAHDLRFSEAAGAGTCFAAHSPPAYLCCRDRCHHGYHTCHLLCSTHHMLKPRCQLLIIPLLPTAYSPAANCLLPIATCSPLPPPPHSTLPLASPQPPLPPLTPPRCHLLPPLRCHLLTPPLPPTYSPPPAAYSPPRTQTHPPPAAAVGRSPLWLWVMCWVGCGPTCSSPLQSTAPGPMSTWPPHPKWRALPANTGQTTSEGGDGLRAASEGGG